MVLLFFDFGSGEILLIVLAIFLIFGPDKIPEMARSLGKLINDVKRASEDVKTEINKEADRKDREKRLKEYQDRLDLQQDKDKVVNDKKDDTAEHDKGDVNDTAVDDSKIKISSPKDSVSTKNASRINDELNTKIDKNKTNFEENESLTN